MLEAGKHAFVEKPLAQNVADAEDLVSTAAENDRVLMVGHLLEYHPAINQLKDMIQSGELGDVQYIYGQRLNLGRIRADENSLWSLGAHDVSVLLMLAGELPVEASARGNDFIQDGVEDVVFGYLQFPSGMARPPAPELARPAQDAEDDRGRRRQDGRPRRHGHGPQADDLRQGLRSAQASSYGDREYVSRSGVVYSPPTPSQEPLRIECEHFVDCVRTGDTPRSDGHNGARVVRVLEALQSSLDAGGAPQPVGEPAVSA